MSNNEAIEKSSLRKRADAIKNFRCKNLIAVLENPYNEQNIAQTIRNINALGVESLYIIDSKNLVPDDWQEMRANTKLVRLSSSAIKWTFVKKFENTEDCIKHLKKREFVSMVTSPHLKGRKNIVLHEGEVYAYEACCLVWKRNNGCERCCYRKQYCMY